MAREDIVEALNELVDQGLLAMGVNDAGETCYWGTEKGCQVLGLEPPD